MDIKNDIIERARSATSFLEGLNNARAVTASSLPMRRIRWMWQGYLALEYITLWSGESALGKSTFACWMIASLTRGLLPGKFKDVPTAVLIIATEDAWETTWLPRLYAAGADLDKVHFQDSTQDWNLKGGMAATSRLVEETDAKLVFVDSVLEHFPEQRTGADNINSAPYVRGALAPFAEMCRERRISGLISTHPPKAKGSTYADTVMASAAFVHLARVGLLFAWHPDDLDLPDQERRRVLMRPPGGSNIGRDPGVFEFEIVGKDVQIEDEIEEVPCVTALKPTHITWRDLLKTPKEEKTIEPKRSVEVKGIVMARLADGGWHRAMTEELEAAGHSKATISRATKDIVKEQRDGVWWWKLGSLV